MTPSRTSTPSSRSDVGDELAGEGLLAAQQPAAGDEGDGRAEPLVGGGDLEPRRRRRR